jgi:hypothetical protein
MNNSATFFRWIGLVLTVVVSSIVPPGCSDRTEDEAAVSAARPSVADRAGPTAPTTLTDIFPQTGSRGLVLNNCAGCHPVACAAIGRRTESEWKAIEISHELYIPGLSIEDHGKIFDYVKRNFNDRTPEPVVPPEFLRGGCPELK